jgi:hypothetical protein
MLNTYELMPFDIPLIDEFYSSPDEVLPKITDADSTNNRDDVSKLEHILRDIMKEQITIALNDSSDEEILDYLEGIGNALDCTRSWIPCGISWIVCQVQRWWNNS